MKITELTSRPSILQDKKSAKKLVIFEKILSELKEKELNPEVKNSINQHIEQLNSFSGPDKDYLKQVRKIQSTIIKMLEKECKLVGRNHYRNLWMALGMGAFGVPFGVAMGFSLGNMAYIGIGIPIGMAVGIAVGTQMDKKAMAEGRQMDFETAF